MPNGEITLRDLQPWSDSSARERDRGRRVHDLGPRTNGSDEGSSTRDWLGNLGDDWHCVAAGRGRRSGLSRSQSLVPDRRWQRHVYVSGVVDDGTRRPRVTTVVFANRDYAVLKREFSYLGIGSPGGRALDMFEIGRPTLDWVQLAKGMGVPGTRVSSLDEFGKALLAGLQGEGPSLIEVPL